MQNYKVTLEHGIRTGHRNLLEVKVKALTENEAKMKAYRSVVRSNNDALNVTKIEKI